jgi:hypothetical protein
MTRAPILILAFRRPEELKRLLSIVRDEVDQKLYLFCDGIPLDSDVRVKSEIEEVHEIVRTEAKHNPLTNILISEIHLGCYRGVYSGVSWFFQNEDKGIILEDDLILNVDILPIIWQYLEKFERDLKIGSISLYRSREYGTSDNLSNLLTLSPFPSSWGWASWKSRWLRFEHHFKCPVLEPKLALNFFKHGGIGGFRRWELTRRRLESEELDSWAYRWMFTHWVKGWNSIILPSNQIENRGFDSRATHTYTGESNTITTELNVRSHLWNKKEISREVKKEVLQNIYGVRRSLNSISIRAKR